VLRSLATIWPAFDDHDLGGYRIANGVAPFIDGRCERHGEKFLVDHNAASGLMEPENQAARSPRRLAKVHAGDIVIISANPVRCTQSNRQLTRRRSRLLINSRGSTSSDNDGSAVQKTNC